MSLQGQHSFPQRRTYGPGFVTEAWGFHPGLKGEVMSDLVERLRRFHDRLNCRVDEVTGTRFKTDVEREAEIGAATTLCWQAADEITRLTARVAELEGALNQIDAIDPEDGIYGCSHDATRGLVIRMGQIARTALEPKP